VQVSQDLEITFYTQWLCDFVWVAGQALSMKSVREVFTVSFARSAVFGGAGSEMPDYYIR